MTKVRNVSLWAAVWLILALTALVSVGANREHKVHNIVLYPNKQSWCTTRNISQVITEPGCKQVTIDNNVCVGACFSYSIPHTEPSDPGEVIGPYCDSCQPSNVSYEFVKVDCTENPNMKSPYLFKQVQLIHNCSCTACEEQSTHRNNIDGGHESTDSSQEHPHRHNLDPLVASGADQELGHHQQRTHASHGGQSSGSSGETDGHPDSDMIQDDIPEILEVVHYSENDTDPIRHTPVHDFQSPDTGTTYMQQQQLNHYEHNSHIDNVKKLLHQKITKLLQAIEETDSQADREQLIEMIRLIKGTSDRNWDELVESLQSENSILDFNRLRSELVEDEPLGTPFESQHTDPSSDIVNVDASGKDGESTEQMEQVPQRKHHHSLSPEYDDHQRLMQHQYDASVRHLHEHNPASVQEHTGAPNESNHSSGEVVAKQEQQHHHHHHAVGERVDAHHHLERGPHGSLVIRADETGEEIYRSRQNGHEIKEQINIHAHELKPNHAGTVVTYDAHHGPSSEAAGVGQHQHPHHQHPHAGHHGHHGRAHGPHNHDEHAEHRANHGHPHTQHQQPHQDDGPHP